MKYLIIAAHPDDEVLGCGGSMAKWAKDGHDVDVLIMAEGSTSRNKNRDRKLHSKTLLKLSQSAKEAAKILNVQSIELLDYPDNRMDSVDLLDVVKSIEFKIEKIKPDVIVTHHIDDLNIDHQIVHRAVVTACRPQPNNYIKRILSFEVPSSTEWQSQSSLNTFKPNWFENIAGTLDLKKKALEVYKDEMKEWPHARSIKSVEYMARWRGATVGFEAAESFMLVREIR